MRTLNRDWPWVVGVVMMTTSSCELNGPAEVYRNAFEGFAAVSQLRNPDVGEESYLSFIEIEPRIMRISGRIDDLEPGDYRVEIERGLDPCVCQESGSGEVLFQSEVAYASPVLENMSFTVDYRAAEAAPPWLRFRHGECVLVRRADDTCVMTGRLDVERRLAE